ncbi:MAG: transglycosylase family protein [Actinomycetota bacterium]|jgi:hypothetical protein|nr:transglycosylase family protein [Actinomycetota bacterium]
MRTRIALATASAVTFMMTSFNIQPAGAAAPAHRQQAPVTSDLIATVPAVDVPMLYPAIVSKAPPDTAELPSGAGRALWREMVSTVPLAPAPAPPAVAPAPPVAPTPPTDATSTDTADWQCIRLQESGDAYNSPTRPSGAYGILEITWLSNGYTGWPYQAPSAVQDALALRLYNEFGWSPWSSRYACGL